MEIILKYFPELTEAQKQQFSQLQPLYHSWNTHINVISRKDIDFLYERHVLHSLAIAKVIAFKPGTKVLDVGTGGGFPGIPLAILYPEVHFYLVDSIGKKIKVVKAVTETLGLKNVTAAQQQAQQVHQKFDFVVSRAVTRMPEFVSWVRQKFNKNSHNDLPNGILYLKGGNLILELQDFPKARQIDISSFFEEDFFETKKVVYLPYI